MSDRQRPKRKTHPRLVARIIALLSGVEHAIAPSVWQSHSLIKRQVFASLFIVVRISDVVLLVSWLSDGVIWFTLQQGLVAPVY